DPPRSGSGRRADGVRGPTRGSSAPTTCRTCSRGRRERRSRLKVARRGWLEHVERDRDVLQRDRGDDEEVEELVIPEHLGQRIRLAAGVDHRAGGVAEAAEQKER